MARRWFEDLAPCMVMASVLRPDDDRFPVPLMAGEEVHLRYEFIDRRTARSPGRGFAIAWLKRQEGE